MSEPTLLPCPLCGRLRPVPDAWNVIEGEAFDADHRWTAVQAALHRTWGQAIDRRYSKQDWLALQDAIDGLRRR